ANPHIVGDIRRINTTMFGKFNEVFFERVPYTVIDTAAARNAAAVLNPGGRISIITGRLADQTALRNALEQAGFRNIRIEMVGTGLNAELRATATLGGP